MHTFYWNEEKNEILKKQRGISLEEVVIAIENDHLLDVLEHPNQANYTGQRLYVVEVNDYAYIVPFVDDEKGRFLKTIFPSRKYTRRYLGKE